MESQKSTEWKWMTADIHYYSIQKVILTLYGIYIKLFNACVKFEFAFEKWGTNKVILLRGVDTGSIYVQYVPVIQANVGACPTFGQFY